MDDLINCNKPNLIKWIYKNTLVLQHVHAEKIITQEEYNDLKGISNERYKNIELIDMIVRKGAKSCLDFFNILKNPTVNESSPDLKEWTSTVDTSNISASSVAPGAHASTSANNPNSSTSTAWNRRIADNKEFLKKNRSKLIQNVKNVKEIADDLNLSDEMRANIYAESTKQDQMRKVLEYTTSKKAAELLINALWKHAEGVMEDLVNEA